MNFKLYLFLLLLFATKLLAVKPVVQWAKTAGGIGDESAYITSIDKDGNVFVGGTSKSSSFKFNTTTLTNDNPSFHSSYLAKYDATGNLLWVKGGGSGNSYSIVGMCNDNQGNVYISGSFASSNLKLGNYTLTNDYPYTYGKIFLAKYNSDGNVLWAIAPTTNFSCGMYGLCVDNSGNIYTTGHFQDVEIKFGSVTVTNAAPTQQDVFLVKFDSSGKALWGKNFGGSWHDVGRSVAIGADGNVLLTGVYKSTVFNIGSFKLTNGNQDANNVFLSKITPEGQVLWANGIGNNGEEFCKSVVADSLGNSFICGSFKSPNISLGNIQLQNNTNSTKSFLVKYNSQGNALWAKTSAAEGVDDFAMVAVDKLGDAYVCGYFQTASVVYDTIKLNNIADPLKNIVIAKFNKNGNIEWAKNFNDSHDAIGNTCSVDKLGNIFMAGDFKSQAIYFDDFKVYNTTFQANTAVVSSDIFIVKIKQLIDSITVKYCSTNNTAILSVDAANFSRFKWINQMGDTISSLSTLVVNNPKVGAEYVCQAIMSDGYVMTLKTILVDYQLRSDFKFQISNCETNTIQFQDQTLSSHYPLTYKWFFGDGSQSSETNPTHSYALAGKYKVKLEVTNPLSTCADTITKLVEVFAPMNVDMLGDTLCCSGYTLTMRAIGADSYLWSDGTTADTLVVNENSGKIWVIGLYGNGICKSDTVFKTITSARYAISISGYQTYCPGLSTVIKASGAKEFIWNNGSVVDSIRVSAPGGNFWVQGKTDGGCLSDTLFFSVSEEPDWDFAVLGQFSFCENESAELSVKGSKTHVWFNNETDSTVTISQAGTYSVTGKNLRGCEKSLSFEVNEIEAPISDFSISTSVVDRKNNTLVVEVQPESDTEYFWEMGDGSTANGIRHTHTYNVRNNLFEYRIKLTSTNKFGCISSTEKSVDVVPFIPNVFTPNGDGINDIFVPDIDLLITDRYGKKLFQGTSGWDGTYNGSLAPSDTYFYYVSYTDKLGHIKTHKGLVTLIR